MIFRGLSFQESLDPITRILEIFELRKSTKGNVSRETFPFEVLDMELVLGTVRRQNRHNTIQIIHASEFDADLTLTCSQRNLDVSIKFVRE